MVWHYVKSGFGTAVTDVGFGTEQTTAFGSGSLTAANCYASIDSAFANGNIQAGEYVSVSDVSSASVSAPTFVGVNSASPIIVQSVDDTAANVLKAGAAESDSGGGDIILSGDAINMVLYGLTLTVNDEIRYQASQQINFRNCTLAKEGSGNLFKIETAGIHVRCDDCNLSFGGTSVSLGRLSGGSCIELYNCTTTGSASTQLFHGSTGVNGGAYFLAVGCDFSSLGNDYLVPDIGGAATADDTIVFRFHNCRIPSTFLGLLQETPAHGALKLFEFVGVDNANSYVYHYETTEGKVVSATGASPYVTADTDVEGVANYSYRIDTRSTTGKANPFIWPLPMGYKDLSVASTDTVRILINTDGTYTDTEVVLKLGTSNSTNPNTMDFVSSNTAESGTWVTNHNAAGSTLTTDASKWDATNKKTNEYAITATAATVDATSPLYPTMWLEVGVSTSTNEIYVGTQPNFEA